MIQEDSLVGFNVKLDKDITQKWYKQATPWGCDCADCRYFVEMATKGALSGWIVAILQDLGIPPEKATYVSSLFTDEKGIHYQFSYRIAGFIVSHSEEEQEMLNGRCCHEPYPYGAPGFPEPHFDLEFWDILKK